MIRKHAGSTPVDHPKLIRIIMKISIDVNGYYYKESTLEEVFKFYKLNHIQLFMLKSGYQVKIKDVNSVVTLEKI